MPLLINDDHSFDRLLGLLEGLAVPTDAGTAYATADKIAKVFSTEIAKAYKYGQEQEAIWAEKLEAADQRIAELEALLAAKPSDEDLRAIAHYEKPHRTLRGDDWSRFDAAKTRLIERYGQDHADDEGEE